MLEEFISHGKPGLAVNNVVNYRLKKPLSASRRTCTVRDFF